MARDNLLVSQKVESDCYYDNQKITFFADERNALTHF